jgi:cytochrome c oxidase subunit 4
MMKTTTFRVYLANFIALMILLGITIGVAYIDLGRLNLPIAMTVSIAKTLLIILFFMHVWHGTRLTWIFAGAGFFWLLILLALAMSDYVSREWATATHL